MEQDDSVLSELSDFLQDDVFSSVLCASAGECTLDTNGILTEVSQIQPDSDLQPMNISGMNTTGFDIKEYLVRACNQNGGSQSFPQPGAVTAHKHPHTVDRPFVCDQDGCNKTFTTSYNLTKHKRSHTGSRPFICGQCNQSFTQSCHLT
ncbi:C2H2-type zinc finger protein, partial [Sansalvadorimonas verongulae]|nr:C2H2-type zinc finger protein [Sansalvadorimonas verongulae]